MKEKHLIIDLCSGGGVLAESFYDSIGVDIDRKILEYYPHQKVLASAIKSPFRNKSVYFAHGSPPCQKFSTSTHGKQKKHIDIIHEVRNELIRISNHYSIENVPKAPIRNDLMLCSSMFGLEGLRHRIFELSFDVPQLKCENHKPIIKNKWVNASDRRGKRLRSYFANKNGDPKINQRILGCRNLPSFVSGEGISPKYMKYILTHLGNPKPSLEKFWRIN